MTTASLPFSPYITTNGQGLFGAQSQGLRQGTAYPDPSAIFRLRGGVLDAGETLPMWGGVAVFENVPPQTGSLKPSYTLGPSMGRANGLTGSKALAGWSVFDSNYSMVTSPQNTVPLTLAGGQVNAYSLGSNARIIVQADPSLISLRGGPIGAQVSWDWVAQRLIPYESGALTISSGTYSTTTGLVVLTMSAPINFGPGDAIVVSSLTGTGSNLAQLNGTWVAIAPTAGSTVTFQAPTGLGATTITGGSLTLGSGSASALPVKVLDIQANNCETVLYDAVTGFATYNFDGCCAVIQI